MSVYKRNKVWYTCIIYMGQKYRYAIGPDRALAVSAQKKLEKEVADARASGLPWAGLDKIQKAKCHRTFEEVAEAYIAQRIDTAKPSTIRSYKEYFESHLRKRFGSSRVSHITSEQIREFQKQLSVGRSACRVNNIMNFMRIIMRHCAEEGLIGENPFEKVKRLRVTPPEIDPLPLDELKAVLEAIPTFYRPIFTVLAWTGMRPSELKALRWSDVNWKRNEIVISRGRVRGAESTPKTQSSRRVVQIHPAVHSSLKEMEKRPLQNVEGYIFTSKKGLPINQHLDVLWSKALKKAGLRHRPSYQLRHTWASMALESGESPAWVSKMLGHSNLATLFKHYARFIPDEQNGSRIAAIAKV